MIAIFVMEIIFSKSLTGLNYFMLFDFVPLKYIVDGEAKVARWSDLKRLHHS